MPKLTCLCGDTIDLSTIPNPQGFRLLWEPLLETFVERLADVKIVDMADKKVEKRIFAVLRDLDLPQVYECANCGRLAIFAHASAVEPSLWFLPEANEDRGSGSLRSLVKST